MQVCIKLKLLTPFFFRLEFVNAKGDVQSVEDAEQLAGVAGCFGLAGIITAITFRMDKMTWAKFHPKKNSSDFKMENSIPRPGTDRWIFG